MKNFWSCWNESTTHWNILEIYSGKDTLATFVNGEKSEIFSKLLSARTHTYKWWKKEKQQLLRSVQDSFQLLAFSVFDSFRKSPVNDN